VQIILTVTTTLTETSPTDNQCTGRYQLSSTSFKSNMIHQRSWDCDGGGGGYSSPSWTAEFSLHCYIQGSSHHLVKNQKLMTIASFPSYSTRVKAVVRPAGNQMRWWKRTSFCSTAGMGKTRTWRYSHMTSLNSLRRVLRLAQQTPHNTSE
jgi:hypothetical protein